MDSSPAPPGSRDSTRGGLTHAIVAPARLLVREARHWLPIVAVLAMIAALPEILIQYFVPDSMGLISKLSTVDLQIVLAGLWALALLIAVKLVVELVALMFAFVILADLSAGRTPNLLAGLRRLGSWKLQFTWIVAGIFEQTAISMWFLGGGMLLLPFGFVTTAAYEEDNGFAAFGRSLQLGFLRVGPGSLDRPGFRVALPVTLAFFLGFVVSSVFSLASCVSSAASAGPMLLGALQGHMPEVGAALPAYGTTDIIFDLLVAPLAMLPTVYMMTAQQLTYWEARRFAEAHPEALETAEG